MRILFLRESTYMHKPWFYHPESPRRVFEVKSALAELNVELVEESISGVNRGETLRLAKRVHSEDYIDYLLALSKRSPVEIDGDTYMTKDTLDLALGYFGLAYKYANDSHSVFLMGRPPGHHAGYDGRTPGVPTQGFCILNNAVAAVHGFRDAGYKKILVLDFDAHHGNGTMEILYREKILQVDFHQDPDTLYPHTGYPNELGEGEGYGYKVNIVLPPGTGDDLFLELLIRVEDLLEKYNPEAIVVSAGFDGFERDGLADLALTEASYYSLGKLIRKLNAPTVILLEGGYGIGLRRGVQGFIHGLLGVEIEYPVVPVSSPSRVKRVVETTLKTLEKVYKRVFSP